MRHQAKLGYGQNKDNDGKLNYEMPKSDKSYSNTPGQSENRNLSKKSNETNTTGQSENRNSSKKPNETSKSSQSKSPKQAKIHPQDDSRQDETFPEIYGFYQLIDDKKELKAEVSDLKLELYTTKTKCISLEDENSLLKDKLWRANSIKADLKSKTAGNPCKLIDGKWTIESNGMVIKMDKMEAGSDDDDFWQ